MSDRTKKEQDEQKQQLKQVIANLALQLELNDGRRFNITKGTAEVIKVIKFSLESKEPETKQALEKVLELLTPEQKSFFMKQGLDLDPVVTAEENAKKEGKKKIVYRGQVKWV